jgi:hypothetical protein
VENESSSFKFGAKQTETGAIEKTSINSRQFPQFHPSKESSYRMKFTMAPILCIIACIHPVFSFPSVPPPAKLLMPAEKNTPYEKKSARGSGRARQAALGEESILKQVETCAASFKEDPAREEERLDTMLTEISSPDLLKKISTPGLVEAAHRKQNTLRVSALIRRILESARVKATARQGKQKQMKFSVTFQKKFESTAAKVRFYSS